MIPLLGWTKSGVVGKSIAAIIQSKIVLVPAESYFAYLQSYGATGSGIFGPAAIQVIVPTAIVLGIGYGGYIYLKDRKIL